MDEVRRLRAVLKVIAEGNGGFLPVGVADPGIRDGRCLGPEDFARLALLPPAERPVFCDIREWLPLPEINGEAAPDA